MSINKLAILTLALAVSALAQSAAPPSDTQPVKSAPTQDYGFQLGTIGGYADFSAPHINSISGLNPGFTAGGEIGLHKYFGFFSDFSYSRLTRTACVSYVCAGLSGSYYHAGGGLEVVGTNHTRFVPYAKVGMVYSHATGVAAIAVGNHFVAGIGETNAPGILAGGGLKFYVNHHFGIDGGVSAMRTVGNQGGLTTVAPTVGVFFQSK